MLSDFSFLNASFEKGFLNYLFDNDSKSIKDLDQRQILIKYCLLAITAFESGELELFDAGVGDQACQIRALALTLLKSKPPPEMFKLAREDCLKLNQLIDKKIQKIKRIEKIAKDEAMELKKEYVSEVKAITALKKARVEAINQLKEKFKEPLLEAEQKLEKLAEITAKICDLQEEDLKVDEKMAFIFLSFLVTKIKHPELDENLMIHDKDHFNKLQMPGAAVEKIIGLARCALSKLSVKFVKETAESLSCKNAKALTAIVSKPVATKKGLMEVPFHAQTKVLFKKAASLNIPVLLKIRNKSNNPLDLNAYNKKLLFLEGSQEHKYNLNASTIDLDQPAIIIEALSNDPESKEVEAHFFKPNALFKFINASTAEHSQFTVPVSFDDENLSDLKVEAAKCGFLREDPRIAAIEHIFSGMLSKHLGGVE